MITLITGQPGAGKTAFVVSELAFNKQFQGRPIFTMGIPELKIPHEPVPPVKEWTQLRPMPEDPTLEAPYFTFPENAIVVIDEAQNVYRPRSAASQVPDHVKAFETHRHTGVDFWLMTQSPTLLDANVRVLLRKHQHIGINILGKRKLYEWTSCQTSPDTKAAHAAASVVDYRLPKKAFALYKSSQLHTKIKHRLPWQVWLVLFGTILAAYIVWSFYNRMDARMTKQPPKPAASQPSMPASGSSQGRVMPVSGQLPQVPVTESLAAKVMEQMPRLPDRPETAPIYDAVRPQIVAAPRPAACVASKNRCTCYTQQATVYPTSDAFCRQFIHNPAFDPTQPDTPAVAQGGALAPAVSAPG